MQALNYGIEINKNGVFVSRCKEKSLVGRYKNNTSDENINNNNNDDNENTATNKAITESEKKQK